MKPSKWKTEPISCTCEVGLCSGDPPSLCGDPTVAAYKAWGFGWMALCYKHALKHSEAVRTDILIASGETWR